jgi:hypothetical protein
MRLHKQNLTQTQDVWSEYGTCRERDEWALQQRVCSAEYFDRYFSYGVADREIGDQELDDLLSNQDQYAARIADLLERKGDQAIWQLIEKTDRRLERLSPDQLVALANAMTALGPRVVAYDEPRFFVRNLFEETASFVARILLTAPAGPARVEIVERIVTTTDPLIFAAECFRWMTIKKSESEPDRVLDKGQTGQIGDLLASRIVRWATELEQPIWETPHGLRLMHIAARGGHGEAMKQHVRKWLEMCPDHVITLLGAQAGRLYGAAGQIQDDLTTETFNALGAISDMDDLNSAVTELRGDEPVSEGFPAVRYASAAGKPTERLVLDQFAWQRAHRDSASQTTADK